MNSISMPRAWRLWWGCNPLARSCCITWCMGDSVLHCGAGFCFSCFFAFAGSRVRVGLLALPLCGAAVTFFAAAKKVTKESSLLGPRSHAVWPCVPCDRGLPKCRPPRPNRAWIAHGLSPRATQQTGSARNGPSPLRGRWVNRVRVCFFADASTSMHCPCTPLVSLVDPAAARSAVPALFRAEPVSLEG